MHSLNVFSFVENKLGRTRGYEQIVVYCCLLYVLYCLRLLYANIVVYSIVNSSVK